MALIASKAEFRELDERAVIEALKDTNPANPIAVEVARLISGYMENFEKHVKQLGYMPTEVLRKKPAWPIEAVAMRLTAETIKDSLGDGKRS
jgi:hypothetical protein